MISLALPNPRAQSAPRRQRPVLPQSVPQKHSRIAVLDRFIFLLLKSQELPNPSDSLPYIDGFEGLTHNKDTKRSITVDLCQAKRKTITANTQLKSEANLAKE